MGLGKLTETMAGQNGGQGGGSDKGSMLRPPKSFGDKLGDLFKDRFPVAGGLADIITGPNNTAATQGMPVPENNLPNLQLPPQNNPDYSGQMAEFARPKGGGGLAALLKLFM